VTDHVTSVQEEPTKRRQARYLRLCRVTATLIIPSLPSPQETGLRTAALSAGLGLNNRTKTNPAVSAGFGAGEPSANPNPSKKIR